MSDWTLRCLQQEIDAWIQRAGGYWSPTSQTLRLAEEVGEIARIVNHLHGEKRRRVEEPAEPLSVEMGDLLFTLVCLANSEGVDLQSAIDSALDKYRTRDAERWIVEAPTPVEDR